MKIPKRTVIFLIFFAFVLMFAWMVNIQFAKAVANPGAGSDDFSNLMKATKTPGKKPTRTPTWRPPTQRPRTATPAPPTVAIPTLAVTITLETAPATPVMPPLLDLQVCPPGGCKAFPLNLICDANGACTGAVKIPAADCSAAGECTAAANLTCTAAGEVNQCSGKLNLSPCGAEKSCAPAVNFSCTKASCDYHLAIVLPPALPPTATPVKITSTPTPKPGALSGIAGFPLWIFVICMGVVIVGLAVGGFLLWRMRKEEMGEEEEGELPIMPGSGDEADLPEMPAGESQPPAPPQEPPGDSSAPTIRIQS